MGLIFQTGIEGSHVSPKICDSWQQSN